MNLGYFRTLHVEATISNAARVVARRKFGLLQFSVTSIQNWNAFRYMRVRGLRSLPGLVSPDNLQQDT